MAYEIEIKDQAPQPVMSIRTRTTVQEMPAFLGRAYGAVAQYLGEMGEAPAGPPFAAYYNMDMPNLDMEAGFPSSKPLPAKGEIRASEIPGGRLATCVYTGPYDRMKDAYEALMQWIKESGCQGTGVTFELYLNDPAQTPPQELKTLIIFPLSSGG